VCWKCGEAAGEEPVDEAIDGCASAVGDEVPGSRGRGTASSTRACSGWCGGADWMLCCCCTGGDDECTGLDEDDAAARSPSQELLALLIASMSLS
jgi:hypothetical protein